VIGGIPIQLAVVVFYEMSSQATRGVRSLLLFLVERVGESTATRTQQIATPLVLFFVHLAYHFDRLSQRTVN